MNVSPSQRPEFFGTDGVRGRFGVPPLDESTVRRLGRALAEDLVERASDAPPHLVLGGDTRDSTPTLGRWLMAELVAGGCRVTWLGTVTTPTVAHLVRRTSADCGVAISASHNPHPDNGIKLIDAEGFKWDPVSEARLEARMARLPRMAAKHADCDFEDGEPEIDHGAVESYLDALRQSLPNSGTAPLDGLHVALDTANGAASPYAEKLFTGLGARVSLAHAEPDGSNINADCGSTHPRALSELIRASGADLGFAFDGDADRVVLADADGEVRDGDAILYLWARALRERGELPGDRLVATSMSNLGLEVALERDGIDLVRCDVGDREVVAAMRREGITLGGEQSGHIIHLGLSTTGDGLLTALQIAHLLRLADRPLTDLLAGFERFPQLIRNVPVPSKPPLDGLAEVVRVRSEIERELGTAGRLVLRYSGTEQLARIMLEGRDLNVIEGMADRLAAAIEHELC